MLHKKVWKPAPWTTLKSELSTLDNLDTAVKIDVKFRFWPIQLEKLSTCEESYLYANGAFNFST